MRIHRALLLAALTLPPIAVFGQTVPDSTATTQTCPTCPEQHVRTALAQVFLTNLVVNRADDWIGQQAWARVAPSDWSRNLRLGWEWDENGFLVNMFAHPYHGGLYLNAGRSNGLSFWESVPLAFLGSFTWEYFGETHRPALNDFFNTSFGGIALGEVFHRIASSIRDERKTGGARRFREIAAIPFDPVGALNRGLRGQWTKIGENSAVHDPQSYVFRLASGFRATVDTGEVEDVLKSGTIVADLQVGDIFERRFESPYDVFSVRAQLSPGGDGLNLLRTSGRLYGRNLNSDSTWHRHLLVVNQRFDYLSNRAYKFGGQSIEGGLASRWKLGKGYALRTDLFGDLLILGALDAPLAGAGERTYDFGPGAGLRIDASLERNGITYVALLGRSEFIHSVSGAEANHVTGLGGLEATLPLGRGLGLAAHVLYYNRRSEYEDGTLNEKEYPEIRFLFVWQSALRVSTAR